MATPLILATKSESRISMLANAGLKFDAIPARIDEETVIAALVADGARPRDVSDALADAKAQKISARHPDHVVIGSDQVLEFGGEIFQKPSSKEELSAQLQKLAGKTHLLHSAAVTYHECQPVWRHIGTVRMTMRNLENTAILAYIDTHWDNVRHCVGGYRIEAEGINLFSQIDGDYFHVLGFPLLETLNYLHLRGHIS